MVIRAVRSGGTAVRWAYGVLLTLCVALAVLVHHETSMTSMTAPSPLSAPAHAAHAMPDAAHATAGHATATSASGSPAHGADSGACAMPDMQHCTTASVGSLQLAVPGRTGLDPAADPKPTAEGRAPAAAVGRAPPDLSVLSQLRI